MKIRLMSHSDIDQVVRLHQNNLITPASKIGSVYLRKFYEQLILRPDLNTCLVAEKKGEIVAAISASSNLASTLKLLKSLLSPKMLALVARAILLGQVSFIELLNRVRFEYLVIQRYKIYPTILTLFVDSHYQRQGIGKMLVKQLTKEFSKKNISRLFVDTYSDNDQALIFYKAMGFKKVDKVIDSFIFEKKLE